MRPSVVQYLFVGCRILSGESHAPELNDDYDYPVFPSAYFGLAFDLYKFPNTPIKTGYPVIQVLGLSELILFNNPRFMRSTVF